MAEGALGREVITLDTTALYALPNRRDRHHAEVESVFEADEGPCLVPRGILAEITHRVEERPGPKALYAADLPLTTSLE